MTAAECEGSGTCPDPITWRQRSSGFVLCDDHAADIDLDDLEDLKDPDL